MKRSGTYRAAFAVCLTAAAVAVAADPEPAAVPEAAAVTVAQTFAERFCAGDHAANRDLMTDDMRAALSDAAAEQVRRGLETQHGPLQRLGDAWAEDVVDGYRRYRVPAVYARATIDLRVVLDAEGKVAGFFHLPHVPSPSERAAAPELRSAPNPAVEGHWEGAIELPGMALAVKVDLRYQDGYWDGAIDIPAQGVAGLPLTGIAVADTSVAFAIADVPGDPTFRGGLAGGEIAGTFSQGGAAFPFRLGRETVAPPARPQEPQPPFPYTEREVAYDSGPVALAGTLSVPAGGGPFPAALLISGSGAQDRDETVFDHRPFRVLADHLARAGVAVLRVDDRGVGGSTGGGAEATTEDFAGDALAGVAFLSRQPGIDPRRIGLIGHSEGGIVAPLAAARSGDVAFIVLLAGTGVPGAEILERQIELIGLADGQSPDQVARQVAAQRELVALVVAGAGEDEIRSRLETLVRAQMGPEADEAAVDQAVAMQAQSLDSPWFRYFLTYDPRPALRKVQVPVLALCGGKDLQVDPDQNLPEIWTALAQGGNSDITVMELPGLNHLFQTATTGSPDEYYELEETFNPTALGVISSWILERFGTGAGEGE